VHSPFNQPRMATNAPERGFTSRRNIAGGDNWPYREQPSMPQPQPHHAQGRRQTPADANMRTWSDGLQRSACASPSLYSHGLSPKLKVA
jgi:hypothetical protein